MSAVVIIVGTRFDRVVRRRRHVLRLLVDRLPLLRAGRADVTSSYS